MEGALEQLPEMRGLNVGAEVRRLGLHEGEEEGALLIDEERLLDHMEEALAEGGVLVEHHGCELFPERWFQAVVVLQTDNTLLWDRLQARGYSQNKIAENVECEIMHVVEEEARSSYAQNVVHVWPSDTEEQLHNNSKRLVELIRSLQQ